MFLNFTIFRSTVIYQALVILFGMAACNSENKSVESSFCTENTQVLYDPVGSSELTSFPDDFYTISNSDSPTGLHLHFSTAHSQWVSQVPPVIQPIIEDLATRSGFSRIGKVFMRFSGPVKPGPETAEESLLTDSIQWLDLSVSPPQRIPFTSYMGEKGDQLLLEAVSPLKPNTQYVVLLTSDHPDVHGNCISPATEMKKLLLGDATGDFSHVQDKYLSAIAAVDVDVAEISHAVLFTTHDDLGEFKGMAAAAQNQQFTWKHLPTQSNGSEQYKGVFSSIDYRDRTNPVEWDIEVNIWLPSTGTAPYPVVVFGHGLNGSSQSSGYFKQIASDLGMAVVATDALFHGVHPTVDPNALYAVLPLLGVQFGSSLEINSAIIRQNFEQTILDRVQMLSLLRQNPDINGDGDVDLNMDELFYYGVSFGSVMAPQLIAVENQVQTAMLTVGGGYLSALFEDMELLEMFAPMIEQLIGDADSFSRVLPLLQTGIDIVDPSVWGADVVASRLDGGGMPNILLSVSVPDKTVPFRSGWSLASGFGVPQVGNVVQGVPLDGVSTGVVYDNWHGATGGYFQFDRISSGGTVVASNHDNVPGSKEGKEMLLDFFGSSLAGESEITDPYDVLQTPELE